VSNLVKARPQNNNYRNSDSRNNNNNGLTMTLVSYCCATLTLDHAGFLLLYEDVIGFTDKVDEHTSCPSLTLEHEEHLKLIF
jgi:hypothetical protein